MSSSEADDARRRRSRSSPARRRASARPPRAACTSAGYIVVRRRPPGRPDGRAGRACGVPAVRDRRHRRRRHGRAASSRIIADTGRIDVLVNNAGYGSYGALEDVPMDEARRQFEVNVFALARLTQLVLPHMREQRSGAHHQRLLDRRQIRRAAGRLVPRDEVRGRGAQRLAADGAGAVRHPRGRDQPGAIAPSGARSRRRTCSRRPAQGPYADAGRPPASVLALSSGGRTEPGRRRRSSPTRSCRAATARRPRTRYRVGRCAKPVALARKLLPDRAWDRALTAMYAGARRADPGRSPAGSRTRSVVIAARTSSRAARRAGHTAARTPTTTDASSTTRARATGRPAR